jgi:hypothetical protein
MPVQHFTQRIHAEVLGLRDMSCNILIAQQSQCFLELAADIPTTECFQALSLPFSAYDRNAPLFSPRTLVLHYTRRPRTPNLFKYPFVRFHPAKRDALCRIPAKRIQQSKIEQYNQMTIYKREMRSV